MSSFSHFDEFGGHVDSFDPAVAGRGQIARGSAKTASDIENLQPGAQFELLGQRPGGDASAHMEFVDAGELVERSGFRRASAGEARENGASEGPMRIMVRDLLLQRSHGRAPSRTPQC